jgi:agmatine/peptidylarginine deiminase
LLNPNRNPTLSREQIEHGLRDYLGGEMIVWLGLGHSTDRDTDGHIDGIAPYLAPATRRRSSRGRPSMRVSASGSGAGGGSRR